MAGMGHYLYSCRDCNYLYGSLARSTRRTPDFTSASVDWGIPAIFIAVAFMALNIYLPRWVGYRSQEQKNRSSHELLPVS